MKLLGDFQRVLQDNESFKNDVRAKLDGLRTLLNQYIITSDTNQIQSSLTSPLQTPSGLNDNLIPQVVSLTSSASTPVVVSYNMDPQTKMMIMLMETYTKLSATLSARKEETKSEWPKFLGDKK